MRLQSFPNPLNPVVFNLSANALGGDLPTWLNTTSLARVPWVQVYLQGNSFDNCGDPQFNLTGVSCLAQSPGVAAPGRRRPGAELGCLLACLPSGVTASAGAAPAALRQLSFSLQSSAAKPGVC